MLKMPDRPTAGRWNLDGFAESLMTPHGMALGCAVYALAWALIGTILVAPVGLHHDVTEAWVWARDVQLGYPKHPPLLGWVVALWFDLLPRTESAFMILAAANAGLAIAGVWAVSRQLLDARAAAACALLAATVPFFNLMALKLNANSIQLALWPWATYAFVRAIETRRVGPSILFGVLGGLAVLGKYYSGLLLVSCLLASIAHPKARAYYLSAAPYVTGLAFLTTIAPHVWWLVSGDMPTLEYAVDKAGHPLLAALKRAGDALSISLLYLAPAVLLFAVALRDSGRVAARAIASSLVWSNAWITILTLGPLLMTVIFAFAGVRISSQFLLPVFFLVPAALLHHGAAVVDRRASSRLTSGAVAYTSLVLLAAPAIATVIFAFGLDPRVGEPRRQVAAEAQLIWREEVGRPLTIVAGQDRYARAVSFYSTDAPSEYAETDPRSTPWVSQDRIRREGLLFVCEVGTVYCSDVERLPVAPSVTIERSLSASFVGSLKPPRTIRFQIVRPQ